jgi:F-type H+-transporting ATPase subunit delta
MKSIALQLAQTKNCTFIQNPTTRVEVKEKALLEILLALMELLKVCFIYYLRKRFEILDAIATEYVKLF